MSVEARITELMSKRAEIDSELEELRAQALSDIEAAQARLAEIDACLSAAPPVKAGPLLDIKTVAFMNGAAETNQPDECDGMGPEESEDETTYSGFVGELKAIREHNMSRRRRRA
jgi:hypothetical protein